MNPAENKDKGPQEHGAAPRTGNASNPTPENKDFTPDPQQLIDPRGEKYLREVANPEDYADPQDAEEVGTGEEVK